jgi:hypothetical protein
MKHMFLVLITLLLAGLAGPPVSAKGWPSPIEAFMQALEQGDTATALAAFSDDATVRLPVELLPPDSRLVVGTRVPGAILTLAGKERIGAWLEEFAGRYNGHIVIQGAAQVSAQGMSTPALIGDDNLRVLAIYWVQGMGAFSVQSEHLTGFTLTLPTETLHELRSANPRIYTTSRPAFYVPRCRAFAY